MAHHAHDRTLFLVTRKHGASSRAALSRTPARNKRVRIPVIHRKRRASPINGDFAPLCSLHRPDTLRSRLQLVALVEVTFVVQNIARTDVDEAKCLGPRVVPDDRYEASSWRARSIAGRRFDVILDIHLEEST